MPKPKPYGGATRYWEEDSPLPVDLVLRDRDDGRESAVPPPIPRQAPLESE